MLVAAQVNRDAQIKVVSMSPAILVWYQIVTSCNLLTVLVFKTVNCNKAVYIDMYFQFCGWHKCCQCCLGAACDQGGHQMTPFVVPTQVHTLVWSCFVLPEHHFCDQGSSQRIMSFDFAALRWTTVGISTMAEELQKDRRQMQRRTERPPGPAQHCTSQFCLDRHKHFCPRNPCNWK